MASDRFDGIYTEGLTRKCSRCGLIRHLRAFSKSSRRQDDFQYYCKTCSGLYHEDWRKSDKGKEWLNNYYLKRRKTNRKSPVYLDRKSIVELLKLYYRQDVPTVELSKRFNIAQSTVRKYLNRQELLPLIFD